MTTTSTIDQPAATAAVRNLLHVGCGPRNPKRLPACFHRPDWREVRFDIDPKVQPDIVGSITDLSMIHDARVVAIWSSHNLELLNPFEVPAALAESACSMRAYGVQVIARPAARSFRHRSTSLNATGK